jgi:CTP synthase (UTP-ammonia lyase)
MGAVKVGIVGDFDRGKHSHWATEAALFHAAARLGFKVEPRWVPTPFLAAQRAADALAGFDGIWGAPGSPYQSLPGMLRAIEYARTRNVPYLGTCGGFQYALIEYSRHMLGLPDADTAENDPADRANAVISLVACETPSQTSARLNGAGVAVPVSGTLIFKLCGSADLSGQYFCSYEVNNDFVPKWEAAGLRVAARGAEGEMRAFDLPAHRFFLATLFQPQLSSSFDAPHPLIEGFLRACAQ